MDSSTVVFLWFSVAWASLFFLISVRKKFHGKLPPGPSPLPIVGNFFQIGKKPHESLAKLAKIHGPLMTVHLGSRTTIVVSSPNMAQEVLQKHDQPFSGRTVPDAMTLKGHSDVSVVWSSPNNRWRNLRKLCNTLMFTNQSLNTSMGIRLKQVKDLIDYVGDCSKSGQAIDVGQVVFSATLNIISNTLFSANTSNYNSESAQGFKASIWGVLEEAGRPNIGDYFPFLRRFDPQGVKQRTGAHVGKLIMYISKVLAERLKSIEQNVSNDLLDVLIHHTQDESSELHPRLLKNLILDLFIAGTDTSTGTVEWAMSELLRNRELLIKAKIELNEILEKNKPIQESDITRLPYLQAIVKETLRLHPPAPLLLPRRAETDVEVCGFSVPRHAQLLVNVWAIGRDPKVWTDPTCFRPERFLESDIDFRGQDFELLPFGTGRRSCPGMPLAHRTVHVILGSLLHSFGWELADGMKPEDLDMEEKFGLTLQKAKPLLALPILE